MTNVRGQARARRPRPRVERGFTLLEVFATVAIAGVIAAMAVSSWRLLERRSRLVSSGTEIDVAVKVARQKALATGRDVAVMVFPLQATFGGGHGRIVVLYDGDGGFLDGTGAGTLCNFDPDRLGIGPKSQILSTIDLPRGVTIGTPRPVPGTPALGVVPTFPFTAAPAPANGCSFCAGDRGAIRFDARGQASFWTTCGAQLANATGGSVAINGALRAEDPNDPLQLRGVSVLYVIPSGLARIFHAG